MAKFELNIYGENDEILKRYETDRIKYGVFMKALEVDDKYEKMSAAEKMQTVNEVVKLIFTGLTDEELMLADTRDVLNTYRQVTRQGNVLSSNGDEKN